MGRRGKSLAQTAYKLIPALALAAPGLGYALSTELGGRKKLGCIVRAYTGYSMPGTRLATKGFSFERLGEGWLPFIAASFVILGVQKIRGILRRL